MTSTKAGFCAVLDGPDAGWLTVTLERGEQSYSFHPSHVPYESVALLAQALLAVLDGRDAVVPWNDEPIEHEFRFAVAAEQVELCVVTLRPLPHGETARDPVFTVSGAAHEVARPLWRALRQVQSHLSPDDYLRAWREPFPAATFRSWGGV